MLGLGTNSEELFPRATIAFQKATVAIQDPTIAFQKATVAIQDPTIAFQKATVANADAQGALDYPRLHVEQSVDNDQSEDEALVLDAFIQQALDHGPDASLSIAWLLEHTELPRAALIEAVEMLEAQGHLNVHWNLNGMFHAQLTDSEWRKHAPLAEDE